ncbi:MAG: tRNA threonylcarbamoyladenosine dehydratase [Ruminococcaceae bacterium]|nr:tRNA threonylcarbamoyladenosine dehydratase [Oscillospiraceae bacterium]
MMNEIFSRQNIVFGTETLDILKNSRVAVFGVGGVGGYICESLARSGVGMLDIVDNDTVSVSNINRQIIALHSTIGKNKVDVMKERLLDINPEIVVNEHNCFFLKENEREFEFEKFDYIVDAIDTVSGKLALAVIADKLNVPIISAMGAGNKTDPTQFKVADIYKTSGCPLAKAMRKLCKENNVKKLKVVYSEESPIRKEELIDETSNKRSIPGSLSFVPSVMGLIMAGEVVKDLIGFGG